MSDTQPQNFNESVAANQDAPAKPAATDTGDRTIDQQARRELSRAGWKVVEPFGAPGHFARYKVQQGERFGFAKYATDELQDQVAKDALWSQLVERLTARDEVTRTVRTAKLLYHTPSCNIFEWIAGLPLATQGGRVASLEGQVATRVARALVALDRLALTAPGREESWFIPEQRKRKLQNMQDGVAAAWERGWLNEVQMRQLLTTRGTLPQRQALLQHGELSPWHIIFDGHGVVLVDGEWSGVGYPRWYDLAYLYGQIAVRGHNPAVAAEILKAVADQAEDGDTVVQQVFALLAERVFFELHNAAASEGEDSSQNATSLLAVILSGEPSRLLRPITA